MGEAAVVLSVGTAAIEFLIRGERYLFEESPAVSKSRPNLPPYKGGGPSLALLTPAAMGEGGGGYFAAISL